MMHFLFQVRRLVCNPSRRKLLILAGQCVEGSGDIVLQKGCFSLSNLIQIFSDEEVSKLCLCWFCLHSMFKCLLMFELLDSVSTGR